MKTYDVAIIGAGSAGLSARREVAKHTDNYIVIDDGPLGTTCARVGCMPSKVLIQVANDFHRRYSLKEQGISGGENLSIDTKHVMKHVRKLRDRFVRGVEDDMEEWTQTHLLRSRAKFVDQNTLNVGDETIRAKKIIIATGSKPIIPKPWQKYKDYLIHTDEFFEMEKLPEKVAVIGLGVIGVELGQALHRLGVQVTGFSLDKSIGGLSDSDVQNYTAQQMEKEFDIHYGLSEVVGEKDGQIQVASGNQTFSFDKVFLTMGRSPSIRNLKLAEIGIELNERGLPLINLSTFQISGTDIFVAGDSTGERALLHEAADEGRIAGYNSVHNELQCFRRREFLAITFSDPNIAIVGQSYKQLKDASVDFAVGEVSFEGQGRSIVMLKEKGLARVYGDKKTGRLLGAELMAPSGEHLAHLLSWAINLELTVKEVLALPFYHPVVEEGLRTALRELASNLEIPLGPLEVLRCEDPPAGYRVLHSS